LRRFFTGLLSPLRGLVFLAGRPKLWPWVLGPVVILVLALVPTALWSWERVPVLLATYFGLPPPIELLQAIWLLAAYVIALLVFVCLAVVEWALVGALARPLFGAIAERIEAEVLGIDLDYSDLQSLLTDAALALGHSALALGLYATGSAALLVLALVPVVGELLAPLLEVLLTAAYLARELLDGPLGRRRLSFAAKLRYLDDHRAEALGLGVATMVLIAVPVLDLAALPAAVVGATLLYCGFERQNGVPATAAPSGRP